MTTLVEQRPTIRPAGLPPALHYALHSAVLTAKNVSFVVFTLIMPVTLYLVFSAIYGGEADAGLASAMIMVSMAAYGSLGAAMSGGAQLALERRSGWFRQLMITSVPPRVFLWARTAVIMLLVLPALLLVFAAGALLGGVTATAGQWLASLGLLWLGLLPLTVLGMVVGVWVKAEAVQGVTTMLLLALSLLGGLWFPVEAMPPAMKAVAHILPSYWLGELGRFPFLPDAGFPWGGIWVLLAWSSVLTVLGRLDGQSHPVAPGPLRPGRLGAGAEPGRAPRPPVDAGLHCRALARHRARDGGWDGEQPGHAHARAQPDQGRNAYGGGRAGADQPRSARHPRPLADRHHDQVVAGGPPRRHGPGRSEGADGRRRGDRPPGSGRRPRHRVGADRDSARHRDRQRARSVLLAAGVEARTPVALPTLSEGVSELFGYVVRESVTNVVRHAEATWCVIEVDEHSVEVRDDGVGVGADRSGRGLTGLGERVAAAGGVVEVAAAPGGGTSVRAVLAPSPRPARSVP